MADFWQFDTSLLSGAVVLLTMGFTSLTLAVMLRLQLRRLDKVRKKLIANVFDQTFSVFNPYPPKRTILHSYFASYGVLAVFASLLFTTFMFTVVAGSGVLLGILAFFFCASLMMFSDTSEVGKNAKALVHAAQTGGNLGEGDVVMFHAIRFVIPKLKKYYVLLATALIASGLTLPLLASAIAFIFHFFVVTEVSAFTHSMTLTLLFLFAAMPPIVSVCAKRLKNRLFAVPPSEELPWVVGIEDQLPKRSHLVFLRMHT